jgi:hypothetical protein
VAALQVASQAEINQDGSDLRSGEILSQLLTDGLLETIHRQPFCCGQAGEYDIYWPAPAACGGCYEQTPGKSCNFSEFLPDEGQQQKEQGSSRAAP